MTITIQPWNGDPPYTAATWNDVQVAIQSGDNILVNGNLVQPISVAGGYLIQGCPLNVLFGAPLTLAQATVLVQNAPMLQSKGATQCLSQAQAMIAASGSPATSPTVSNAPTTTNPNSDQTSAQSQTPASGYTQGAVASASAPSINNALPSGPTSQTGGQMLSQIYRFILQVSGGYATGANRQGCSQTNSAMCDPQFFPDPGGLQTAIAYALQNGEIPYKVDTSNDPWLLMAGSMPIDPSHIYNADGTLGSSGPFGIPWWMLIAAGVGVYILTK
jgi:hypothetical protein